jgi:hypothetical protein
LFQNYFPGSISTNFNNVGFFGGYGKKKREA